MSSNVPGAAIYGCSGLTLTDEEKRFFAGQNPLGFILFARNCGTPEQLKALIDELRACVGRDAPILIDQEGGRVARLKPPHWREAPPAKVFADLAGQNPEAAREAVFLNARLIAAELMALGIDVNCAPLADVPVPGAHDIIGDRAFGNEPETIALLGREMANGLMAEGVTPILKHIPGHGRATVDSHEDLPVVEAPLHELQNTDFIPFRALHDLPWGMTAHIIYTAIDEESPATHSPEAIRLIREDLGFDGLLLSDDVSMKALKGSFQERTEKILGAGCDIVLHCNGKMEEMQDVASAVTPMTDKALERFERGRQYVTDRKRHVPPPSETSLRELLAPIWQAA